MPGVLGGSIENAGSGGAGTVTNTGGALTLNAVVVGAGGNDEKTLASLGSSGQVLLSNGAGSPPSFQSLSAGYFWGGIGYGGIIQGAVYTGAAVSTVNNNVIVVLFVIPWPITITKASINVTTLQAASTVTMGIYSSDGNTKILDTGTFDSSTTGVKTNTFTGVLIPAGAYYFAQSTSNTGVQTENFGATTNRNNYLNTTGGPRQGTAANSTSGGVLPSTLGAITNLSAGISVCFFSA